MCVYADIVPASGATVLPVCCPRQPQREHGRSGEVESAAEVIVMSGRGHGGGGGGGETICLARWFRLEGLLIDVQIDACYISTCTPCTSPAEGEEESLLFCSFQPEVCFVHTARPAILHQQLNPALLSVGAYIWARVPGGGAGE